MLFTNVRWRDGRFDLRMSEGRLAAMAPVGEGPRLQPQPDEEQIEGGWLTPVIAEP